MSFGRIALGVLAIAAAVTGCGAGGGTGTGTGTGAGATSGGASAVSQARRQAAQAALGGGPHVPLAVTLDQAGLAAYNDLFARNWPALRTEIDPRIQSAIVGTVVGAQAGPVRVLAIRNVVLDTAAPPALRGAGPGTLQTLTVELPGRPGTWRLALTADVGTTIATTIAGVPVQVVVSVDVAIDVDQVRVEQPATLDLSNPVRPLLAGAGAPQVSLRIALRSQDPLLSQITGPLTALLDPLIRAALVAGSALAQQQLGTTIAQVPQTPWGQGGLGPQPVPGAPPLEPLAVAVTEEIRRVHMPFDTVLPARFDRPGFGQGAVVEYEDYGDSAIWTGTYLAGEAFRFDLTQDPRALAAAERAVRGLEGCLDVWSIGGGLLGRCVVPLASPHVRSIQGSSKFYTGTANGQPAGALGGISRDQYIGAILGLAEAHLRVPSLRPRAAAALARIAEYLDQNDFVAYDPASGGPSAPFGQAPAVAWFAISAAHLGDPARFAALHARYAPVTPILWFAAWGSSREVHDGYYKFNLMHEELLGLVEIETDPARYRDYVRTLDIARDVTGHHENAWFDAIYGIAVPAAAPALGPRVKDELDRLALRPRRGFPVTNSTDPAIAKAVYSAPTNPSGAQTLAVHPLPIERRATADFLWQRSPFELDGTGNPHIQYPGVDLVAPYWAARSYGLIR